MQAGKSESETAICATVCSMANTMRRVEKVGNRILLEVDVPFRAILGRALRRIEFCQNSDFNSLHLHCGSFQIYLLVSLSFIVWVRTPFAGRCRPRPAECKSHDD